MLTADAGSLFASMAIGAIGFALFTYGRKQARMPQLVAGLVLMVYPYFVDSVRWMAAIATMIVLSLWYAVRAGW